MSESINELRDNLTEVKVQVDRISNCSDNVSTHSQLQDLKTEIASVKGLLLSRYVFYCILYSKSIKQI